MKNVKHRLTKDNYTGQIKASDKIYVYTIANHINLKINHVKVIIKRNMILDLKGCGRG